MAKSFQKALLESDDFAQYSLRATFFVRALRSLRMLEAMDEVNRLSKIKNGFSWQDPSRYGIDAEAWERIESKGIEPTRIFCHPQLITEQPSLLLYYRTIAVVSQKGLAKLVGGNIAKVESGKQSTVDLQWAQNTAFALNSIASAVVRTAADIHERDFPGFQFATAGATIQGSWNNQIGSEGDRTVRTLLVNELRGEIEQVVWRNNSSNDYSAELHAQLIDRIADVKLLRLKHGYRLLFASEPDVSLRDPSNTPLLAIEVKAGTDAPGALERLGAAMKSFENDRSLNPRVKTVYVVRCITPEVQRRISQGHLFDHTFGLADLLTGGKSQKVFANLVLRTILRR